MDSPSSSGQTCEEDECDHEEPHSQSRTARRVSSKVTALVVEDVADTVRYQVPVLNSSQCTPLTTLPLVQITIPPGDLFFMRLPASLSLQSNHGVYSVVLKGDAAQGAVAVLDLFNEPQVNHPRQSMRFGD